MPLEQVGSFDVSRLQVLDPQGVVDADLDPGLAPDRLYALHRAMVLAREADQRMLRLQRQGRIGTFAPSTGQEAAVVGPALAMTERDWLVPSFREPGALLARGMPLWRTLLYHNGYEEGNVLKEAPRTLPQAVIVGSQTLHAVGIAYAIKYRQERDSAVVTFFGDGATSQGDFHEALNFAALWQAPVVFICQNNHWAISMPRSRQTRSHTLAQKAIAYDMPGLQVDGNDVLAMYRATAEALERARGGGGPTLIEAVTYRLMMHTTADDPRRYRSEAEVEKWRRRDPLTRFQTYLESRGLWDEERQTRLMAEVRREIDAAVQTFESLSDPKPDAPFDHVFAAPHPEIEAQRAEFLAHLPEVTSG